MPEHKQTKPRKFKAAERGATSSVLKPSKPRAPSGKKSGTLLRGRRGAPTPLPLPRRRADQRPPFAGFDRECETYARLKADLMGRAEGLYVVIQGEDVEGPVETYGDALRAGYRRLGSTGPSSSSKSSQWNRSPPSPATSAGPARRAGRPSLTVNRLMMDGAIVKLFLGPSVPCA